MISIIVPIYNTERYLDRCIRAILNSTYRDFELLLINDGSEDNSGEVCKKYLKKHSQIRYYEQKHKGVSAARNRGIEECHGEWIIFVDSDDAISCDFLDTIAKQEYQEYDLLIFDYALLKDVTSVHTVFQSLGKQAYEKEEMIFLIESTLYSSQLVKTGRTSLRSSWAEAYKSSIINQYSLRFSTELAIAEDTLFNIEYLLKIKSCLYLQKKVYFFELRPNSATHGFYTGNSYLQNDIRYQKQLVALLKKDAILHKVKIAYYNSVLFHIADALIKGIFNPYSTRTYSENRKLCQAIDKNDIYKNALKYNSKMGKFPRRILLFFFRRKCYHIVELICRMVHEILKRSRHNSYI